MQSPENHWVIHQVIKPDYNTLTTKVVTLNPSRNTLHLAKHTKSIDLDHLKSTQHSLATQHHKYSRLRRDYTCSQYKLKSIQLQSYSTLFENPKLDVNVQIFKINFVTTEKLKYLSLACLKT